jgi:methylated-DNA-[protein]-cysteine S-methyltransferase
MRTPVGKLLIEVDGRGALLRVAFDPRQEPTASPEEAARCAAVVTQLEEYFAGRRRVFELELAPQGTDFQLRVWAEVQRIPYGRTTSYGELARRLDNPLLSRAVGTANGANPIPIVIPCHRVVGADGSLVGYGGGLEIKRALLDLEAAVVGGTQERFEFTD